MKTKLLAFVLCLLTVAGVLAYPPLQRPQAAPPTEPVAVLPPPQNQQNPNQRPQIDVVFVLDTTGSMGGLIQAAKEKIWAIASSMAQAQPAPEIRLGLVAYRDRGDAYVTRVVDLSADLDTVYAALMDFKAEGGGDGPESVNEALHDALHKISWRQEASAYKVVFLVGDAPPHRDYQDDVKYTVSLNEAKQRGIVVNSIQCGNDGSATADWRQIAQLGGGSYFQVGQAGNAVAVATPFDKKLAELSAKLDGTRLYYGDAAEKAKQQAKMDAAKKLHTESSVESQARRATFNASSSGAANLLGDNELVEEVQSGRVDVTKIERDKLPEPLQNLAPAEQKAKIEETAKQRAELRQQINELSSQRAEHLKKEVEQRGGAKDSLDQKIYGAVRDQAKSKGMSYAAPAPAY
ncbi:MAG: VWA domain-containing protein [Candidatus Methylumidiphilus sp.]